MSGAHTAGGGQGDEHVALPLQQEDGLVEAAQPSDGRRRPGQQVGERPGRLQIGGIATGTVDLGGQGHVGGDHVGWDAGAVDATDTEHPLHALFRRRQAAPVGKEVLAHTGHRTGRS